jgi:tetratricopeptide (TPR) repeat protein
LKKEHCSKCQKSVPMNDMFTFRGQLTCDACLEEILMHDDTVKREEIEHHLDPTVCVNCARDTGNIPLETLSGLPTCSACVTYFRNRPFPAWIKAGFAILLIVVVLHLVANRRFWLAYQELKQADRAENLPTAAALYASAAQRVPENAELGGFSAFLVGLNLLQEDRSEEALPYLESSRDFAPPDFQVDRFILAARSNIAFDNGDYDEFLRIALQMRRENRDEPIEWARAASAYACKYAVTGDMSCYRNALAYLDSARVRSPGDTTLAELEMRVMYRLHTKEILTKDEFYERYPQGWAEEDD